MVNQALLRSYFWGGTWPGGVGWPAMFLAFDSWYLWNSFKLKRLHTWSTFGSILLRFDLAAKKRCFSVLKQTLACFCSASPQKLKFAVYPLYREQYYCPTTPIASNFEAQPPKHISPFQFKQRSSKGSRYTATTRAKLRSACFSNTISTLIVGVVSAPFHIACFQKSPLDD